MRQSPFIADLAWEAVEARLADGAMAILPVGAGAKQHGRHMPMHTDQIQAEWLATRLAESRPLLIWPTLTYGYYPAFRSFPGSVSLSEGLFTALVAEVVVEILRWKPERLFVLDTGISTLPAVATAVTGTPARHLRIHEGPRYRAAAGRLRQQADGSHADELETSRMLVIAPGVVEMALAQASPPGAITGPLTRVNAPSGSYGDPTLATAAKGEELLAAMLEDLIESID